MGNVYLIVFGICLLFFGCLYKNILMMDAEGTNVCRGH